MDGQFFGFPLAESQSTAAAPMDISSSCAYMDISTGMGFERPGAATDSEIEVGAALSLFCSFSCPRVFRSVLTGAVSSSPRSRKWSARGACI